MAKKLKGKKARAKSTSPGTHIPADMQEAIETFFRKSEGIVNAFAADIEKEPPPPMIYQYTNDVGLRGILENGKLWFTDIFNLNDPAELKHGISSAVKIISAKIDEERPEIGQFSNNLSAMLQGAIEETAHYFVCCFSKAGDDLGQWRAYADNGRGYAIGFEAKMLEQAFANATPGPGRMTFPITYGEEKLREIHQEIIDEVLPLISKPRGRDLPGESINDYMSELLVNLAVPILRAALFFKHDAYINEQEYRFFQLFAAGSDIPDIKYRSRPYSLIRYREFDWRSVAPETMKSITIGPAADRALARRFVEDCLRTFHPSPKSVSINQSDIPYRAS